MFCVLCNIKIESVGCNSGRQIALPDVNHFARIA
jgi:hypothetical protein